MNDRPLVSVITATYNMRNFIAEAIESVLNQTYDHIDYIIVDDGSTDNTKEVVDRYASDKRLRYVYQENQGQTVTKNNGLKLAKGEYICYLDADNIWLTDKLEKQINAFKKLPEICKIVYTHQNDIDDTGKVIHDPQVSRYSGKISAQLLKDNFVTFNTAMVHKDCFVELGGFDENLARSIDYELWLRFSTKFEFYYLPELTTYYRRWEGQMSQDVERRFRYAMRIMNDFIAKYPQIISKKEAKDAYSYSFASRAKYFASKHRYIKAAGFAIKSLVYRPFSLYAWKTIVKMFMPWRK